MNLAGNHWICPLLVVGDMLEEPFGLQLQAGGTLTERMVLCGGAPLLRHGSFVLEGGTHLRCIIRETVGPYQVQIILELLLRLVVPLFDLLEHGL